MTISDIHYLDPSLQDGGEIFTYILENSDGKTTDYSKEILDTLIQTVIEEKPDVFVITGDISFNGSRVSHLALADSLKTIEDNGIDVLVISGNHDLRETAMSFHEDTYEIIETITETDFSEIYKDYGYDENYLSDPNSNSFVYKVNDSLWLLCLDANYSIKCSVSEDTLKWVNEVLKQSKKEKAYVISFTHQNILQHSPGFNYGFVINRADKLLAMYKEYGVQANFAGHIHCQHIKSDEDFYEVLTSSTSIYENHYGIIDVTNDKLVYNSYNLDVAKYAKDNNSADEKLLNFDEYSKDLFLRTNSAKASSRYEDPQIKKIIEELNLKYFIGKLDDFEIDEDLFNDSNLSWKLYGEEFGNNYNHLEIDIK